jgi:hypothetical protein
MGRLERSGSRPSPRFLVDMICLLAESRQAKRDQIVATPPDIATSDRDGHKLLAQSCAITHGETWLSLRGAFAKTQNMTVDVLDIEIPALPRLVR